MKLKTLIQAGCGLLAFISIFFPWYVASIFGFSASTNAFGEVAIGIFALLATLAALAWFGLKLLISLDVLKIKLPLAKNEKIVDTCVGGFVCLMGIIAFIYCLANGSGFMHPGFGTYLYIILGAAIIVLTWVKLEQTVGKAPKKAAKAEKKEAEKEEK